MSYYVMSAASLVLLIAVPLRIAGQEPKADDPVEQSAKILTEAIKEAKSDDERVRLIRALAALKVAAKPVKVIDMSKGQTLEDGALKYTLEAVGFDKPRGQFGVSMSIKNTSTDDTVPGSAWPARVLRSKLTDDLGRVYENTGDSIPGIGNLRPGATATITLGFKGNPSEKAAEFYVELPHFHDKPDTVLLFKKADLGRTKK